MAESMMSPGAATAKLRVEREARRRAVAAREAAEQREDELRERMDGIIAKEVERRVRSAVESRKASESSRKRAVRDLQLLKRELMETHEMFKSKLTREREARQKVESDLDALRNRADSLKCANQRLQQDLVRTSTRDEGAKTELLEKIASLEEQIASTAAESSEKSEGHEQALQREKESRFSAEAARRQAERAAKRARAETQRIRTELEEIKSKTGSMQQRLDRFNRERRGRAQAMKDLKESLRMAKEEHSQVLADKEAEIARLAASKERAAALAQQQEVLRTQTIRDLEARIDADRASFQLERSKWVTAEQDRDQAKTALAEQLAMCERMKDEVECTESKIRDVQSLLEDEQGRRIQAESQMAAAIAERASADQRQLEFETRLRRMRHEVSRIKSALRKRGISIAFVLKAAGDEAPLLELGSEVSPRQQQQQNQKKKKGESLTRQSRRKKAVATAAAASTTRRSNNSNNNKSSYSAKNKNKTPSPTTRRRRREQHQLSTRREKSVRTPPSESPVDSNSRPMTPRSAWSARQSPPTGRAEQDAEGGFIVPPGSPSAPGSPRLDKENLNLLSVPRPAMRDSTMTVASTDSETTVAGSSSVAIDASFSQHKRPERGASAAMWANRLREAADAAEGAIQKSREVKVRPASARKSKPLGRQRRARAGDAPEDNQVPTLTPTPAPRSAGAAEREMRARAAMARRAQRLAEAAAAGRQ